MTSAVRAVPKSGFLGSRLGCGDIHALNRCFILTISPALYLFEGTPERADRIISRSLVPSAYGSSDSSTLFANSNFAVAGTHPLLAASIFPFFSYRSETSISKKLRNLPRKYSIATMETKANINTESTPTRFSDWNSKRFRPQKNTSADKKIHPAIRNNKHSNDRITICIAGTISVYDATLTCGLSSFA